MDMPLELGKDLRLHARQLDLGKAELLTDALLLPFTDIENRLTAYRMSVSSDESRQLTRSMKAYLGRLNANPLLPLKFRLSVLNRFEQELDLFDAEMTAAVLNAHKIAIALVQEAARTNATYFVTLIDMIANAIELAVKLLLLNMAEYRTAAVIVTRQFFDLTSLGLSVTESLKDSAPDRLLHGSDEADSVTRLQQVICQHEMLRKLDFYSKTPASQQLIWQELQHHLAVLEPHFCRKGQPLQCGGNRCMLVVNLNRPNDPARVSELLPERLKSERSDTDLLEYNCIVIGLDALNERLQSGVQAAEQLLLDQQLQQQQLHTEDALDATLTGGRAILACLHDRPRRAERSSEVDARVRLRMTLAPVIAAAFSSMGCEREVSLSGSAWNLVNFTAYGACLEHVSADQSLSELIGCMVGLEWIPGQQALCFAAWKHGMDPAHAEPAALAVIRWVRESKAGEQRIGVAFFGSGYKLARASITGADRELNEKRSWPVLIRPGKDLHQIIFPDQSVYRNMVFTVSQGQQQAYFKIRQILTAGANYSACEIVRAGVCRP